MLTEERQRNKPLFQTDEMCKTEVPELFEMIANSSSKVDMSCPKDYKPQPLGFENQRGVDFADCWQREQQIARMKDKATKKVNKYHKACTDYHSKFDYHGPINN